MSYSEPLRRAVRAEMAVLRAERERYASIAAALEAGIEREEIARALGVNASKITAWAAVYRDADYRRFLLDVMTRLGQEAGPYDEPERFVETR